MPTGRHDLTEYNWHRYYRGDPRAEVPELLPEIDRWYGYLFRTEEHPADNDWIYIVPEGYAIDRKVQICEVRGMPVAMDVIYPSGQSDPVPLSVDCVSIVINTYICRIWHLLHANGRV